MLGVELFLGELEIEVEWLLLILGVVGVVLGIPLTTVCGGIGSIPILEQIRAK